MSNWNNMTSRERDAVVATTLGWTDIHWNTGYLVGFPKGRSKESPIPHYTTDYAAIDPVIKELQKDFIDIVIHIERERNWLALNDIEVAEANNIAELLSLGLLKSKGADV